MKKIAVMLPVPYRGGSLRAAKNIAKALIYAVKEKGLDYQIIFSYTKDDEYDIHQDFSDLIEVGISIRETVWYSQKREKLLPIAELFGIDESKIDASSYFFPEDGTNNFYDCDLWIIISDRLLAPIFPANKYICVIYDYIQRYVPEIFSKEIWQLQEDAFFPLVRNAERVFVTTPSTQADIISYAGVSKYKVDLINIDFSPIEAKPRIKLDESLPKKYFLWPTNIALHKNHINAINALEIYYQDLGGSLPVVVTGVNTHKFAPDVEDASNNPYVVSIQEKLRRKPKLLRSIFLLGNVSDTNYASILSNAQFLWHPITYDNGTFSVLEAAHLNIPSLSVRYPAMEYINHKFQLNLKFFDSRNVSAIASALFEMEKHHQDLPSPNFELLESSKWQNNAEQLIRKIQKVILE